LHNSKTNLVTYRPIIQDKVNLSVKFKGHEDIKLETSKLLSLIQRAAKEATQTAIPKKQQITYPKKLRD